MRTLPLALCLLLASVTRAQDDAPLVVTAPIESRTDALLDAARRDLVQRALEALPEVAFFATGRARAGVEEALAARLRTGEEVEERPEGGLLLRARASRAEARAAVLDVIEPEASFAKEPVLVVVPAGGLSEAERGAVLEAAGAALKRYRFRLHEGEGTKAPVICTVRAAIEPGDGGRLRASQAGGRLFHRGSNTVLAEVSLRSDAGLSGPRPGVAPELQDRMAMLRAIADAAVMGLVRQLAQAELGRADEGPQARNHIEVRLAGLDDDAAERVQRRLLAADGFSGWKEGGAGRGVTVLRCTWEGKDLAAAVRAAVEAAGVQAEVTVARDVVTIRPPR